jgi:hypothetical protein
MRLGSGVSAPGADSALGEAGSEQEAPDEMRISHT